MAYVRMARVDVVHWHNPKLPVMGPGEYPGSGRFVGQYVQDGDGKAALEAINAAALATPRTRVIAGSVGEGRITYETRSRVVGFPDYTTVTLTPLKGLDRSSLQIFARLRYGQSDLGVNEARVRDWAERAGIAGP